MLLWMDTDFVENVSYLHGPRISSLKVICKILADIRTVAAPDADFIIDPNQEAPYVLDSETDILPSRANKANLSLVEIVPRPENVLGDAPFDEFNFVLRRVHTNSAKPIGEAIK